MAEKQIALLKDLRSTGYFFEELKNYSKSLEMDISTYCSNYAIPYLTRISESYGGAGQVDRCRILTLAIKHLSTSDDDVVNSIFGLKKVAVSEIDKEAKAALHDQFDKTKSLSSRRKLESAESLMKLLVNIIKAFKLTEVTARQRKAESLDDPVGDAIMRNWEATELPRA